MTLFPSLDVAFCLGITDITYQQASGRVEFFRVENVGVGVKIVILRYSEAEIHAKWKFMAAILDFKMADITYQQASGRIEFFRVENVGVGVKIVILCYSEAEIHDI